MFRMIVVQHQPHLHTYTNTGRGREGVSERASVFENSVCSTRVNRIRLNVFLVTLAIEFSLLSSINSGIALNWPFALVVLSGVSCCHFTIKCLFTEPTSILLSLKVKYIQLVLGIERMDAIDLKQLSGRFFPTLLHTVLKQRVCNWIQFVSRLQCKLHTNETDCSIDHHELVLFQALNILTRCKFNEINLNSPNNPLKYISLVEFIVP